MRLLDHAEALYRRAGAGVSALPRDCRVAIAAARHIYADVGRVIRSRGYDSVSSRAMTSGGDKLRLALRALPAWLPVADRTPYHSPLSEIRFLVEDVRS